MFKGHPQLSTDHAWKIVRQLTGYGNHRSVIGIHFITDVGVAKFRDSIIQRYFNVYCAGVFCAIFFCCGDGNFINTVTIKI